MKIQLSSAAFAWVTFAALLSLLVSPARAHDDDIDSTAFWIVFGVLAFLLVVAIIIGLLWWWWSSTDVYLYDGHHGGGAHGYHGYHGYEDAHHHGGGYVYEQAPTTARLHGFLAGQKKATV